MAIIAGQTLDHLNIVSWTDLFHSSRSDELLLMSGLHCDKPASLPDILEGWHQPSSGGFHLYPHFFILSEVFISSPLFHLSSVIYRILSGSSSRIFIFLPHLIRLADICSIWLHLCHLSSSSASSHPSNLILTVLSLLPQHLYLYSTDQGPEHS